MRKYLSWCSFVVILLAGCGKEPVDRPIWDFAPGNVCFIINDHEGNNLLDPDTENNILNDSIVAEYNGKQHVINEYFNSQTRAIKPMWFGLRVGKYVGYAGDDGTPALLFGEFSPVHDYRGEMFTIDWGDGTSSEIVFDSYVTWAWNREKRYDVPTVHKSLWIDGELVSDNSLISVGTWSTGSRADIDGNFIYDLEMWTDLR